MSQVKSGTIFDNFLITDDPALAEEVGEETWGQTKVTTQPTRPITDVLIDYDDDVVVVQGPEKKMTEPQAGVERRRMDNDRGVCSVDTARRTMALDSRNKELIGGD